MSEIRKKQKELDKATKYYDARMKQAKRASKTPSEIQELGDEAYGEIYPLEEEVKIATSRDWERRAAKLLLPVPSRDEDGMWQNSDVFEYAWYLTPLGITKVRNLIREELSARRKAFLEMVTPLTGIIGAATGLVAVILTVT
jgi:hypothetical protein